MPPVLFSLLKLVGNAYFNRTPNLTGDVSALYDRYIVCKG